MTGPTHDHAHDHDHDHAPKSVDDTRLGWYEALAYALGEAVVENGLVTAEKLRRVRENLEKRTPENGAQLVARAWTDSAYKERLLADGNAGALEEGFTINEAELIVVENTPERHNLIVCTLCSCYPRSLLGQPPDWYISKAYRAAAVREPRAVLSRFGFKVPDGVAVTVHDSNADMRYLVLPERPAGTEGWDKEALARLVTRDHLIGVAVPTAGGA